MPKDLQTNISAAKDTIISLLSTDLDLAFTFLETARISEWPESKVRNVDNALKAYREVSAKLPRVEMPSETRQELQSKLNRLAEQLIELGQRV